MRKVILATTLALALGAAGALMASAATIFFQGFETDTSGWFSNGGTITRVASETNGVPSAEGDYHAEVEVGADFTGVSTQWGGYESVFPLGGYVTSVDIYLDMAENLAASTDKRFDYSSAINGPDGLHRRDFIFSVGTDPSAASQFVMSASNNAPGWPGNPGRDPFVIDETGWYTFRHTFQDNGSGVLEVVMEVLSADGTALHEWTLSDPSDVIGTTVGGNRYGWFVTSDFDFIAIDNSEKSQLAMPESKDDCKQGGWQDVTRADGSTFKNQGDCIQYVNTGK